MKSLVLVLLFGIAIASKVRYDNFKVYKATPINNTQLNALRRLEELDGGYNFWSVVRGFNIPVHIMIPPDMEYDFKDVAEFNQIEIEVWIDNVQDRIDNEKGKAQARAFGFTNYYRLADIYGWLDSLAATFPGLVTTVVAGQSYEGRVIKGVRVSFSSGNSHKGVFLEGGIHAREWISPATVCYILNEILTSTDPAVRQMAERYDWYVFPATNPDGYEFTHTNNRMWRKTRVPYGSCYGADLNRNWGYRWNTGGSSTNPCSETYAGPYAFSEPETSSLSEYLGAIQQRLIAYIGFHSYGQLLLWPFGHTATHLGNHDELLAERPLQA